MPFNLRGGRPKNMLQGIYWVQRHRDDQRAATRTKAVAQRRAEQDTAKVRARLERCRRLYENVKDFFDRQGEITVGESGVRRISAAQAQWEKIRATIFSDLNSVTATDVNRFATAGKDFILTFSKAAGFDAEWIAANKQLRVESDVLDFS